MANGRGSQGGGQPPQITKADIRQGVKEGMRGVENKIDSLTTEVQNLNQRVNKIERSKLEGKVDGLENIKPHLEKLKDDTREKTEEQEEIIQNKYDENMNELIERFVDRVQANTETLDLIRGEYEQVADLRDSMFDDLEKLGDVYNFNYRVRNKRLKSKRKTIENNFDEFLERREDLKELIDGLKSGFQNQEPIKLHVPVWVCGTKDGRGNENTYIYTPSSIEHKSARPTESQPYIEHFQPMLEKIEEKIINLSQEERERAKKESILKPEKLGNIFSKLDELKHKINFIDSNLGDEGGSLFVNKLKQFVGEKGGMF